MTASDQIVQWNQSKFVWSSFRYFSRSHLALTLGIATATAVIVGALVVGDSVRGSLRGLVMTRLANVELLLQSRNFFQLDMVEAVARRASENNTTLVPLVLLTNSSVEFQNDNRTRRATHVQVLGVDDAFAKALDSANRRLFGNAPGPDEVVVNESLSRELGLKVGDQITLLLSKAGGVPADNPLGRRDDVSRNLPRQKIVGIVSDNSIGAIRFQTSQEASFNVFASLQTIQEFLEVEQQANSILGFSHSGKNYSPQEAIEIADSLSKRLRPKLEDFGLQFDHHRRVYPDKELGEEGEAEPAVVYDYYQVSSKDLLIEKSMEVALVKAIGEERCTQLLAYLANSIQKGEVVPEGQTGEIARIQGRRRGQVGTFIKSRSPILNGVGRVVPYSIVVGVSSGSELQLQSLEPTPEATQTAIGVVNTWLANELELKVGDKIQLEFFEPETTDGRPIKAYTGMRVVGISDLANPVTPYRRNRSAKFDVRPSNTNDPNLTPSVPGITDQESISNWDVPFELELRDLILSQDDKYWEDHRLTPKVYMWLPYAQQMFGSRFGDVTSIRIPASKVTDVSSLRESMEKGLHKISHKAGFVFQPIKLQQLRSASGTTPFDMLFLSLSFFVIVAAFLLVAILFRLGIQQRTTQLGILTAQGFSVGKQRSILLQEFLIVATLGSVLGIPLGLGYARLMVAGLESLWLGAISTNFLSFSFSLTSLAIGTLVGILASMLTIFVSLRRIAAMTPLSLLRGQDMDTASRRERSPAGWAPTVAGIFLAVVLAGLASGQSGMARAGCFFGSGMLLLASSWLGVRQLLVFRGGGQSKATHFLALAIQAIHRNPLRSSLSIGLLAVASFLIASMGVFRMSPTRMGYGGFDLIGVSTQPIFDNMGSPAARREAIGPDAEKLSGTIILPMRMREGDDASCTNLFQVTQPTILGIPLSLQGLTDSTKGFEFSWAASTKPNAPWDDVQAFATGSANDPIPVILDQNTAMWSLKQGGSLRSIIKLENEGNVLHFRVVGLLSNSVLQGKLMISERNFQRLFPKISGYRFFMINSGNQVDREQVVNVLENGWSPAGLDVIASEEQLNRLLGVQNTYISAFQSLGALGLLLGTIGLVAVQLRSVSERRRELALMQAVGFSKRRIGNLLTVETALLLGIGLLIGVGCAALALIPYIIEVGPQLSLIQPLLMLGIVFACGFLAAVVASIYALKQPLLENLRTE